MFSARVAGEFTKNILWNRHSFESVMLYSLSRVRPVRIDDDVEVHEGMRKHCVLLPQAQAQVQCLVQRNLPLMRAQGIESWQKHRPILFTPLRVSQESSPKTSCESTDVYKI